MYKVNHASMPRTTALVYNGHRCVSSRCDFYEKRAFNHYLIEDVPCKNQMQLPLPIFSRRIQRLTIPEVKRKVDEAAVSCLHNSWHNFSFTSDGLPDTTIVHFRPTKETPKNFVAFDVEKYLTERLLKAIDLDPKIVNGF
ncbi:hypothetical protein Tcan_15521 [Toxocara canis]|uniref:Uncharacterized protein n=1 Tax=Toxocara canis TaxID=6265 RepID=A0A0B2W0G5_TOXCA|nr:hypothetical protein Tcan_15521 [Toxocara canis]